MSGVANKEEALRCLQIAEKALRDRDFEKADRFCQKARKLCLCDEVRLFQRKLSNAMSGGQNASSSAGPSTTATTTEGVRQRHVPNATSDTATSRPKATKEQEALVSQILKSKDFYDILSITKDATEDDIKKAYKKLALKLHPDKNSALRAEEAFKAVSRAFSCLSDSEKRKSYDQFGHEDPGQAAAARRAQNFYADDIDPQELFNMFFGGGFPMHGTGHVYRTQFGNFHRRPQNNHHENHQNTQPSWGAMLHFLPMIFLFLFTFWGGRQESAPYSLNKESMYNQEMFTKTRNVPFYVHDKRLFAREYPEQSYQRNYLEREVETRVMRFLQSQCQEETLRQRRVELWRGKDAANRIELTSCDRYTQLFQSRPSRTRVQ